MRQKIERVLLVAILALGLACAWIAPIDDEATKVVDRGLTRSLVSFASARALHAGLSLVQSADVSVKPLGLGGSISLGQLIRPANELVGQFAELMLAASIAFSFMKFLIVIGSAKGVSLLFSLAALWSAWLWWNGKVRPIWLSNTLLVLVLIRFSVPVVSLGSEVVFTELLVNKYETAQSSIKGGDSKWETFKGWITPTTDISGRFKSIEQAVENWVKSIVDLVVLFLLQTLVVPLFLFWILYRIVSPMLDSTRRTSSHSTGAP